MLRVLHESSDTTLADLSPAGDTLSLDRAQVERATGWTWKPEGLCRGETCIPLRQRADPPMVAGDRLDVAALWHQLGWPVVHDSAAQLWVLGDGATSHADALTSLHAPDFELPDLHGRLHRLSAYRGRRIFLATWASW